MAQYELPEGWQEWPIKQMIVSGKKVKARYDEKTGYAYTLDENGEWTGTAAKAMLKSKAIKEEVNEENLDETAPPEENIEPKGIKLRNTKKNKTNPILLAIIAVLVVLLFLKGGNNANSGQPQVYEVIIAMENIQPGEPVAGRLSSATITAEEYRQYTATGGLYHADQYKAIKDFIATEFIQKDSLVTYANVGKQFSAKNPWRMDLGTDVLLTVPVSALGVNLAKYICGNVIDLNVTVETTLFQEDCPDIQRPTPPEGSGSTSQKTTQIDTYILKNLTIVDILDKNKSSIYSTYAALAAIPEEYRETTLTSRYNTASASKKDIPMYIVLRVSGDCLRWHQQITQSSKAQITYTVVFTNNVSCANDAQTNAYTSISRMIPVLARVWNSTLED